MANASGVNTGLFARRAIEMVGPAIAAASDTAKAPEPTDPALAMYTGTYSQAPWGGELAVVLWKGSLAAVSFPTDDPLDGLTELKKTGEHTFRRLRDDKTLGEEIVFDVGPDGRVTRVWRHSNFSPKVR